MKENKYIIFFKYGPQNFKEFLIECFLIIIIPLLCLAYFLSDKGYIFLIWLIYLIPYLFLSNYRVENHKKGVDKK
jgi:asparagine N-glycosylation enzyme membrane subunit Stt3